MVACYLYSRLPKGKRCHAVVAVIHSFIALGTSFFTSTALASDAIVFKPAFSPQNGWLHYGLAIVMLLTMCLIIAKKYKPRSLPHATCQLIEKKYLGNKTIVYIIEYQQQRFILADNHHALALQPLTTKACDETV